MTKRKPCIGSLANWFPVITFLFLAVTVLGLPSCENKPIYPPYIEPDTSDRARYATLEGSRVQDIEGPVSSRIWTIDGRLVSSLGPVKVTPGEHYIKVEVESRGGYTRYSFFVDLEPGRAYTVKGASTYAVPSSPWSIIVSRRKVFIEDKETGKRIDLREPPKPD